MTADARSRLENALAAALVVLLAVGVGAAATTDDAAEDRPQVLLAPDPTPVTTPEPTLYPPDVAYGAPAPDRTADLTPPSPDGSPAPEQTTSPTGPPRSSTAPATSPPTAAPALTEQPEPTGQPEPVEEPLPTTPPGKAVLTLVVDRTSVRAGEAMTATVTLTNTETEPIRADGLCQTYVTGGAGAAAPSRVSGRLADFRAGALADPLEMPFTGPEQVCEQFELAPGASRSTVVRWTAATTNDSAYDDAITVHARTGYRLLPSSDGAVRPLSLAPPDPQRRAVAAPEVAGRLVGGQADRMRPSQALDLALADPEFARAVTATDPKRCAAPSIFGDQRILFDEPRSHYEVRLCTRSTASSMDTTIVTVDPATGAVSEPQTVTGIA